MKINSFKNHFFYFTAGPTNILVGHNKIEDVVAPYAGDYLKKTRK